MCVYIYILHGYYTITLSYLANLNNEYNKLLFYMFRGNSSGVWNSSNCSFFVLAFYYFTKKDKYNKMLSTRAHNKINK